MPRWAGWLGAGSLLRTILLACLAAAPAGCLRMTPDVMDPSMPAHANYTAYRPDGYGTSRSGRVIYPLDETKPTLPDDSTPNRDYRYPTEWLSSGLAPRLNPVPMTQTVYKPKGDTKRKGTKRKGTKRKRR